MIYDLNKPVVIQDTIHIITKLKTRFLKPGVVLPMGSYFVSSTHIEQLMKLFSKDQHFLTTGDLQSKFFSSDLSIIVEGPLHDNMSMRVSMYFQVWTK